MNASAVGMLIGKVIGIAAAVMIVYSFIQSLWNIFRPRR